MEVASLHHFPPTQICFTEEQSVKSASRMELNRRCSKMGGDFEQPPSRLNQPHFMRHTIGERSLFHITRRARLQQCKKNRWTDGGYHCLILFYTFLLLPSFTKTNTINSPFINRSFMMQVRPSHTWCPAEPQLGHGSDQSDPKPAFHGDVQPWHCKDGIRRRQWQQSGW